MVGMSLGVGGGVYSVPRSRAGNTNFLVGIEMHSEQPRLWGR
jgi:hypothetical protein